MRQSNLFASTLREAPADAEAASHRFMLRAGYIRQLAAGIYSYLPLGWRVLRNMERIVREEMDRAGAQEMLMPALQPAELWKESGRYSVYGPELIRLRDRHEREFALGPTHEEVITALVKNEIHSHRDLPVNLYQIQTKFRDERRPRYGLLRGREFLMKDAYSFDTSWEGLDRSYWQMFAAYKRFFERCGLNFRAVEADAGSIGGEGGTHEFMALADLGEDTVVTCSHCDYAANLEKAESGKSQVSSSQGKSAEAEKIHTPGVRTIEQLEKFLAVSSEEIIKTLIFVADGNPVAVLVRGDHEVNELKVKSYLGAEEIEIAAVDIAKKATGAPVGFAGPIGLTIPVLADRMVEGMESAVIGANEQDFHLQNVSPGRDFPLEHIGDFRNAVQGDPCPRCSEGVVQFSKGIEVGHVFKLGTKYSEKLGATYLDAAGKEQAAIMGCYGIGVSRLLSAIAEQNHDEKGMIWSPAIAPFHVHLIPISVKDDTQMRMAEELYSRLQQHGVQVLLDDREERPGVKFNDSDLIGIPVRIIVGKHAEAGNVEYVLRKDNGKQILTVEEAIASALEVIKP